MGLRRQEAPALLFLSVSVGMCCGSSRGGPTSPVCWARGPAFRNSQAPDTSGHSHSPGVNHSLPPLLKHSKPAKSGLNQFLSVSAPLQVLAHLLWAWLRWRRDPILGPGVDVTPGHGKGAQGSSPGLEGGPGGTFLKEGTWQWLEW